VIEGKSTSPTSGTVHGQGYSGYDLLGQLKSTSVAASPSLPRSQNCGTENAGSNKGSPLLNHSNSSSTDTASEGEISSSLLSNEVMESSPPPSNTEDGDPVSGIKTPESRPTPGSRTRITVKTLEDSPEASYRGGGGGGGGGLQLTSSILNQALLANKSLNRNALARQIMIHQAHGSGRDNEDEFEEDDDEEEEPQPQSGQYGGVEEDPDASVDDEEQGQPDSNEEEEEEKIELIDLGDS